MALTLATLPAVALGAGQPRGAAGEALARGGVELSTGLSLSVGHPGGDRATHTLLNVPLRVGFMVGGPFEVEGEALLTHAKSAGVGDTGVTGAAHVLGHLRTSGDTVPFLLAGVGYGNAMGFGNVADKTDHGVWLVRAGLGVKSFFGPHAALRADYRFTHYGGTWTNQCAPVPGGSGGCGFSFGADQHDVLVGVSLWF